MLKDICRKKACLLVIVACSVLMAVGVGDALAGTEDYVGEISWVGGNFPPQGTAFCDGQLLPIAGNEALFSVIGCQYGGNCQSNFALPDMRGRVPMHWGSGPSLSPRQLGEVGGVEQVTLQMTTTQVEPADSRSTTAVSVVTGAMPHNNMQPYLGISCTINLYGIYPTRN